MKIDKLDPVFVEFVPAEPEEGKLYVSMPYASTTHLCACRCGNKVVLPLSPAEWKLCYDGESVSMSPSVGNWGFPCRSHYWIEGNEIRWAPSWTEAEIEAGRRRDAEDLDALILRRTSQPAERTQTSTRVLRRRFMDTINRWLRRWGE